MTARTSQAFQPQFAMQIAKGAPGTYLEIGSHEPVRDSNTYELENTGWTGFSLEFVQRYVDRFNAQRNNKTVLGNAITFDYTSLPQTHYTYLSADIDPAVGTYKATKKILEDGMTFDCITYEHDMYCQHATGHEHAWTEEPADTREAAHQLLSSYGYRRVVTDVYPIRATRRFGDDENLLIRAFEDWYVADHIDFEETTFNGWLTSRGLQ